MMSPDREPVRRPALVRRPADVLVGGEATVTQLPPAPPPGPAAPEPPPAEPAAATRVVPARRVQVAEDTGSLWLRILAAGESARRDRALWAKYSPYLPEFLWLRVQQRIAADTRATRQMQLAANHYFQVAFEAIPRQEDTTFDAEAAAGAGLEWLTAHPGAVAGSSSGSQLTKAMKEDLIILRRDLSGMPVTVPVWAVLAAYTEQLLDALDTAPPQRQ